jgi:hypothetical protein
MNTQLSSTDKMLVHGRRWADFAHRATTYGLLGLAGISAVLGAYGLFGLVGHNRRQKRAFIDREFDRLHEAQQAFLRGEADAEQLHLLEQERAGEELKLQKEKEKVKAKSEGLWGRTKSWIGMGAAAGELGEETPEEARVREMRTRGSSAMLQDKMSEGREVVVELRPVAVQQSGIDGVGLDSKGRPVPMNKTQKVTRLADEPAAVGDTAMRISPTGPGSLDVMANNMADSVAPSKSKQSWMSWIRGSS